MFEPFPKVVILRLVTLVLHLLNRIRDEFGENSGQGGGGNPTQKYVREFSGILRSRLKIVSTLKIASKLTILHIYLKIFRGGPGPPLTWGVFPTHVIPQPANHIVHTSKLVRRYKFLVLKIKFCLFVTLDYWCIPLIPNIFI